MISIYKIKPAFQKILNTPTRVFAKAGITANQVTIFTALLSIGMGVLIFLFPNEKLLLFFFGPFLLLRMALNAIDGLLAKDYNMKSSLGAILNEVGDVVSDTALILPLALVTGFEPKFVVLIVCLSIISEFSGILVIQIGATRRYDGPMGKSDRALVFGIVTMLIACGVPINGNWLSITLYCVIFLLLITIFNRLKNGLKNQR